MKRTVLILFLLLVSLTGCGDKTVYGPGFSWSSYRRIGIGTSRTEVIRLLGKPLRVEPHHFQEKLLYMDETQSWPKGPMLLGQVNTAWFTLLMFDEEGRLTSHEGEYLDHKMLSRGVSKDEVLARFGEPHQTTVDEREGETLVYASQDPRYRRRDYWSVSIDIDADGRVSRKIDQFVVD